MSEQRDEFATERRETIIEALSWWEDEDGRWGHERARDVLAAHEDEWCSVPPTQPPAAPETDVSAWVEVLRGHLVRDRYDEEGESLGTYCTCGGWSGNYFADGEPGPFDLHLAEVIERIVVERVRVVEGERDAARAVARRDEAEKGRLWQSLRDRCATAEARAESAEAAHEALVAAVEALIRKPSGARHWTKQGRHGSSSVVDVDDLRALLAGAR